MVICSLPLVNAVFLLSYVVFVRYLPETSAYANYINAINQIYSAKGAYQKSAIQVEPRVWFNPTLETKNYVVSGLFIIILLAFPPMLTALGVVREKENGSIQQIFVSPIRPYQYVLG